MSRFLLHNRRPWRGPSSRGRRPFERLLARNSTAVVRKEPEAFGSRNFRSLSWADPYSRSRAKRPMPIRDFRGKRYPALQSSSIFSGIGKSPGNNEAVLVPILSADPRRHPVRMHYQFVRRRVLPVNRKCSSHLDGFWADN